EVPRSPIEQLQRALAGVSASARRLDRRESTATQHKRGFVLAIAQHQPTRAPFGLQEREQTAETHVFQVAAETPGRIGRRLRELPPPHDRAAQAGDDLIGRRELAEVVVDAHAIAAQAREVVAQTRQEYDGDVL